MFAAHSLGSAGVLAPASVQQEAGESITSSLSLLLSLKQDKIQCKLVRCGLNGNEIRVAALLSSVN